jgi:hypothetical protein
VHLSVTAALLAALGAGMIGFKLWLLFDFFDRNPKERAEILDDDSDVGGWG